MALGRGWAAWRGGGGGWAGWRWRGAAALALLALLARAPLGAELRGAAPRVPPHALAASLADFNRIRSHYDHM